MILADIYSINRSPDTQRQRTLTCWSVIGQQANDPDITIYRLRGVVEKDSETDKPEDVIRFTRTSPIVSCIGNEVTTASGSKYLLEGESISGNQHFYTPEQWLPSKYLNSWIDGDNWLTI